MVRKFLFGLFFTVAAWAGVTGNAYAVDCDKVASASYAACMDAGGEHAPCNAGANAARFVCMQGNG